MEGLSAVAAAVLGVVFLWSGAVKAGRPRRWLIALRVHALPRPVRAAALAGVPWGELAVVALLVAGWHRIAGVLCLVMLAAFSVALVRLGRLMDRAPVDCGCFGGTTPRDVRLLLARNAALAVAAGVVVIYPIGRTGQRPAAVAVWVMGATAWVVWQAAERISNARQPA